MSRLLHLCASLVLAAASSLAQAADIPPERIRAIDLSDAGEDDGWVAPVSPNLAHLDKDADRKAAFTALLARIDAWQPQQATLVCVHARLNAAALADLGRSDLEAEINFAVFAGLLALPDRPAVLQATAAIALGSDGCTAAPAIAEIGLATGASPEDLATRIRLLARKLLIRLNPGS
jgi:hypothetical protein